MQPNEIPNDEIPNKTRPATSPPIGKPNFSVSLNEVVDDVHEDMKNILAKIQRKDTLCSSDTIIRPTSPPIANPIFPMSLKEVDKVEVDKVVDDVHKEVKNIMQILAETQRSATLWSSDTVVQQMPLKPSVFHGRDDIIEEVTQLLMKEETSRVCILGAGGIGKTSVSLGVVEQLLIKTRFLPENLVWVPCVEATSSILFLEILSLQLQIPQNNQVTIEEIIYFLDASTQPRLILLDNFETPYNSLDGSQKVKEILNQLSMLSHVAILVTMRGIHPPYAESIQWQSKVIRSTDEAACLRIYRDIYPGAENDPDVHTLLGALGHMPLPVALMARLAKEQQSTAKELLSAWSKDGPDILPYHHEYSLNRSISLSVDSNLMKQNPQALLLLKFLSCLPAGTTKATLRWWVPALDSSMVPSAIATLSKAGLLVENQRVELDSPVFFVLPVVQSFMHQRGRIEELIRHDIRSSCYQYVLDHACRDDNPAFPIKSKALAAEDINIQAILYGTMPHNNKLSDKAIEAFIAFSWYRCDTKPNLQIAQHTASMARASGVKRYIASSLWCLGTTYGFLGEFYAAYDSLQEAYQLFNTLLPGDRELQLFCCRCGIDMVNATRFTFRDDEKAVSLARDIKKRSATISDDLIHGRSLMTLGLVLDKFGHRQEALRHLELAELKVTGNILISQVFYSIALVQYHENRLPEALDAVKEAWEHAKSSNSLVDQAQTSLAFGMILFSVNRDAEAWEYMERSLTTNLELGNRRNCASTLEYMGYGYLRRGDYLNAYGAYGAAAETYLDEEPDGMTCKDNLAKIKDKQRNPELNVGFERPRTDNDWPSLFYPVVQDNPR